MDWTVPTAAIIPGLDGVALYQLYRVEPPQTAAEIHRRAGSGSLNGVRYALDRMAEQGIVDADRVGRTVGYRLNRDHVVYPAIVAAFEALDPWGVLVGRLRQQVEVQFPPSRSSPAVSLAVYGSVARREAGPGSDVDLLLVLPDADAATSAQADALTDELHQQVPRWTGNDAHVYRTTRSSLVSAFRDDEPLALSWARDAITVVGPNVHDVLRGRS